MSTCLEMRNHSVRFTAKESIGRTQCHCSPGEQTDSIIQDTTKLAVPLISSADLACISSAVSLAPLCVLWWNAELIHKCSTFSPFTEKEVLGETSGEGCCSSDGLGFHQHPPWLLIHSCSLLEPLEPQAHCHWPAVLHSVKWKRNRGQESKEQQRIIERALDPLALFAIVWRKQLFPLFSTTRTGKLFKPFLFIRM